LTRQGDKILERHYRALNGKIAYQPCTRVSRVFIEMKTKVSDAYGASELF
jgi:hypothetical protein